MAAHTPTALAGTLRSGYIGQGPRVEELEKKLADLTGLDNVLCTSSCTAAIELALDVIGIKPGDKVISTPITCLATNSPLVRRGVQILWADVDSSSGVICPNSVKRIFSNHKDVRAFMAVDYAGHLAPILELRMATWGRRIPIIEDAAHVFSPNLGGGDFICLSFQAIKFLTCGDGGALLMQKPNPDAELLRWFGLDRNKTESFRCSQKPSLPGSKLGMNDVAATIGLANWGAAMNAVRLASQRSQYYSSALKEVDRVLHVPPQSNSPWLYPLLVDDRDDFIRYMDNNGVEVSPVHSRNDDAPVHKNAQSPVPLPGVKYFDEHQACLPVGSWVSGDDAARIARLVNAQGW